MKSEIKILKTFIFILIVFYSTVPSISVGASTSDIWIKGFGPVEFGQECSDKSKKYETFKIDGYFIEAKCFGYKGVKSGKVFFISISTNTLSAEAAQNMIIEKIAPKLGEMKPRWMNCFVDRPDFFVDCSQFVIPGIVEIIGKGCYSAYKNSIKINNFHDVPQNAKRKAEKGLVELKIWAPERECLEKKRIDYAKTTEEKKSVEEEMQSDIGQEFLEKLK